MSLLLVAQFPAGSVPALGQDEVRRKIVKKIEPDYPQLALRNHLSGVVKIMITVDKSGAVKNTELKGGNPVLANAALEAVKKWKYQSGSEEETGIVEFHFVDPSH